MILTHHFYTSLQIPDHSVCSRHVVRGPIPDNVTWRWVSWRTQDTDSDHWETPNVWQAACVTMVADVLRLNRIHAISNNHADLIITNM